MLIQIHLYKRKFWPGLREGFPGTHINLPNRRRKLKPRWGVLGLRQHLQQEEHSVCVTKRLRQRESLRGSQGGDSETNWSSLHATENHRKVWAEWYHQLNVVSAQVPLWVLYLAFLRGSSLQQQGQLIQKPITGKKPVMIDWCSALSGASILCLQNSGNTKEEGTEII